MTDDERHTISVALRLAGRDSCTAAHVAHMHQVLTELVRLAERLDGRIAHMGRQLAASQRPAGLTAIERGHVRSLRQQVERMEYRLELSLDGPVRYALTPAAEALFRGAAAAALTA